MHILYDRANKHVTVRFVESELEQAVNKEPVEAPKQSFWKKAGAYVSMLALAGTMGLGTVACGPDNPQPDGGTDADVYDGGDGDADSDVDGGDGDVDPSNPLLSPDPASHSPSNGTEVGADDDPLSITGTASDAADDYDGNVNADITATFDRGTADEGDDLEIPVVNEDTTPGATVDGSLPLDAAVDGETIRIRFNYTATDADAPNQQSLEVAVTYRGVDPLAPVIDRVELNGANSGTGFGGQAYANSPAGETLTYRISTPGMADNFIDEWGSFGGASLGPSDVGLHPISIEVEDESGRITTYENQFFVDMARVEMDIDGTRMLFPEDFATEINEACGDGFNPSQIPATNDDPHYVFEVSRVANGAAAMACVWALMQRESMGADLSRTMQMYTEDGQELSLTIEGEPDMIQTTYMSFN